MEMFLVLTPSFSGQDERVFSSPGAAFSYAKKQGYPERPEIVEVPVIGELEHPDTVYTVTWHDGTEDTQNVENIYGNYHEAKRAVGGQGRVLRREIMSP